MKVKKKSHPGLVFDGSTGQLISSAIIPDAPEDIPSIVERYILLVGKIVGGLETKAKENTLQTRDVSTIVALGKTMAMFSALEEAKISRVGGKSVKEMSTKQLKQLAGFTAEQEGIIDDDSDAAI